MSYKRTKGGKLCRQEKVDPRQIDSRCDIQVDAKGGQYVMVFANPIGRRVVEEAFPDVEWTTDEKFSRYHSDEWLFTHVRVTQLPPHLEKTVPLAFASPDAIGFAVASSLQRRHGRHALGRVIFYSGQGKDLAMGKFGDIPKSDGDDITLYAEYVPAGTPTSPSAWGQA